MVLGVTDSQRDGLSLVEGLDVSKAEKGKKLTVQDSSVFEYIVRIQEILGRSGVSPDRIVCDGENLTLYFGTSARNLEAGIRRRRRHSFRLFLRSWKDKSGTLHLEHYGELTETIRFEKAKQQRDQIPESTIGIWHKKSKIGKILLKFRKKDYII